MVELNDEDGPVARIEAKLDALSVSVDRRFDEVTAALVEQRQYTEFAFSQLDARLGRVEHQIGSELVPAVARLESGFARFERKLDRFVDAQAKTNELVERRLERLERSQA